MYKNVFSVVHLLNFSQLSKNETRIKNRYKNVYALFSKQYSVKENIKILLLFQTKKWIFKNKKKVLEFHGDDNKCWYKAISTIIWIITL